MKNDPLAESIQGEKIMAAKEVPGYTQVPVTQADLADIHIVRLNSEATVFQATILYEVRDSDGEVRSRATFSQQGAGVLAAPAIAALLAAINAVQGT